MTRESRPVRHTHYKWNGTETEQMGVSHMRELDSAADVMEVLVPFQHLGLVCGQVRAHEAQ